MIQRKISRLLLLTLSLFCFSAAKEKVKNVLIVGDSISIGYMPYVSKSLAPDVVVEHNAGNGGSTVRGKESIEKWLGDRQWDVVLFNFGLHDLVHKDSLNKYDVNGKVTVPLDEYRQNLEAIVKTLRQTTATLVFINTTMVPENSAGRKSEDVARYNEVALRVMKKNAIEVLDLYTPSLTIHPINSKPGNVHYTDKGYELLAEHVVERIKAVLK